MAASPGARPGGRAHDSVLLLAFGGPVRAHDVRPFLDNVLRGKPVPKERYEEVVRHYEEVGGASPLHRLTFAQADGLREILTREGPDLPVYVGMRHWDPFIADTLAEMAREGRRRAIGIVLAAHRSAPSWDAYLDAVDGARKRLGNDAPEVDYVPPWSDHPLFVEAVAARTRDALDRIEAERRAAARMVFTAHSIPVALSAAAGYAEGLARTAALVAQRLGIDGWSLAYTSRSGNPREPWLEPDISDALGALKRGGGRDVVVSPMGFLTDHVEVLYDLDVAARRTAGELGLGFFRAGTAGDHPAFRRLLLALVRDVIARA